MLLDRQTQFSDAQAITASAASTDLLDLGVVRNIGDGTNLYLVFIVTVAFTDSGSDSTVTPSLQTDDNAGFGSATTIRTFDVLAALTPAKTKRVYKLEAYNDAGRFERYLRVYYTVAGGDLTTGSISAFLVESAQVWKAYPVGFSIT